ncbi:MAG: hypothetical protein QOE59_4784 [Actinomycetota bacterium]|jgi:hypothetical protein|nr:hypothetical protein [Actinomycetota bacterium]
MTGPDDAAATPEYAASGAADGAHEAAEIAAFLAAEAIANDYHAERLVDDVVD